MLRFAGAVVDAVGYGSFAPGEGFAGEGGPAPDVPAGASLARHFANVDSDDNASDFAESLPSPGVAPVGVPEPTTALLVGLGLVGLARAGGPGARTR